jgi:8-oxo-dGTP diphosphatase
MVQIMVLVLFVKNGCLYLGLKKLKIGEGKLNAPGGKIEPEDKGDPRLAAVREVRQECGVRVGPTDLKQVALLHIGNQKKKGQILLHVFMVEKFSATFKETKELGELRPYLFSKIDYDLLMPADRMWLADVLLGMTIEAHITYNPKRTRVLVYRSKLRSFV